jgi:hypothetical protein
MNDVVAHWDLEICVPQAGAIRARMVPARVSQNINPSCEQARADHDGGENAASDAEPTKPPPTRRRVHHPETFALAGCGRHTYICGRPNTSFSRSSDSVSQPLRRSHPRMPNERAPRRPARTPRRPAAAERGARTCGRPGSRRDAEPRLQNSRLIGAGYLLAITKSYLALAIIAPGKVGSKARSLRRVSEIQRQTKGDSP